MGKTSRLEYYCGGCLARSGPMGHKEPKLPRTTMPAVCSMLALHVLLTMLHVTITKQMGVDENC